MCILSLLSCIVHSTAVNVSEFQGTQQRDPTEWLSLEKAQWNLLVPAPVDPVTKTGLWDTTVPGSPIPVPAADPTLPTVEMPACLIDQLRHTTSQVQICLV